MSDGSLRHTPVLTGIKQVRALSVDSALMEHVGELIAQLTRDNEWLEVGDTVAEILEEAYSGVYSWYSEMLVGAIAQFMGPVPDGWLPLDGSTYDEADYPELYAQLDTVFKNEIAETFTLPDFDDSVVVGSGGSYGLGDTGGAVSVGLSVAELPAHSHNYVEPVPGATIGGAGPPLPVVNAVNPVTATSSVGSGDSHENMPPYVALWFAVYAGRV